MCLGGVAAFAVTDAVHFLNHIISKNYLHQLPIRINHLSTLSVHKLLVTIDYHNRWASTVLEAGCALGLD